MPAHLCSEQLVPNQQGGKTAGSVSGYLNQPSVESPHSSVLSRKEGRMGAGYHVSEPLSLYVQRKTTDTEVTYCIFHG